MVRLPPAQPIPRKMRDSRSLRHVDEFERLAAENDADSVAGRRTDDAGDGDGDPSSSPPAASATASDVEAPVRIRTVHYDARRETDYVIVVHGTFDAPPADGTRTWYQPPAPGEQNFCAKMGALLARGPIGAGSVWRELPPELASQGAGTQGAESHGVAESSSGTVSQVAESQGGEGSHVGEWQRMVGGDVPYPFFWDGSNTHEGRVKAAEKLARLFDLIARSDPSARIHVISHSHGGNVLLKATELYMKKLPTESLSSLHPAIRKRFWAAHRRGFDMVKVWRQPARPSGWQRLFPSPVVMRSMTGGKVSHGTKERYPWGRYHCLDSLLGLPTKRQRLFLAHRLATSPLSNALGSLVFLGTPFYVKKWERNGIRWLVVGTVASIVVTLVVMWGYAMLVSFAIRSIVSHQTVDAPYIAPLIASALILVFATISVSIELSRSAAFYSGNIYHAPDFDWSPAMSALVVHAGKLDEASLALSSEPIARAYVFPHLANMLKLPFWKSLPQLPPKGALAVDWLLFFATFGRILLWNIIFILPAIFISLASHVVAPMVIGVVRNVIVTISFGLAQNELSFAHVFMDEILDLGLSSQHVEHWNVQKLLALAKTRSLQGELMAGYEDDTCDMGEAVFQEGLLGEGLILGDGEKDAGRKEEGVKGEEVKGEGSGHAVQQKKGGSAVGGEGVAGSGGGMAGVATPERMAAAAAAASAPGAAADAPMAQQASATAGTAGDTQSIPAASAAAGVAVAGVAVAGAVGTAAEEEKDKESRYRPILDPSLSASAGQWQRSASRLRRRVTFKSARTLRDDTHGDDTHGDVTHGDVTHGDVTHGDVTHGDVTHGDGPHGHVTPGDVTPDRPLLPPGTSLGFSSSNPPHTWVEDGEGGRAKQPGMEGEEGGGARNGEEGQGEKHGEAGTSGGVVGNKKHGEEKLLYDYLWDDNDLDEAAAKCLTYQCLEPEIKKMQRNPRLTPQQFVRQIKELCVMIEDRFRELTGKFDLNHGAYFRDPRILGVVAHFLEFRELPEWSRAIDTDVLRAETLVHSGLGRACAL
ncbi:hypothetical protein CLOM_g15365 [Closterium sp. NIES-68]|nr:hypothetical protein CLOM_g15365 [Closterium sp. NIES-68]GJP86609.1 hypothetical protein CLOP_g16610 [Closterium sp. NIES-67]